MALTKLSTDLDNIQALADRTRNQAAAVKAAFDKAGNDIKIYINDTLTAEVDVLDSANVKLTGNQTVAGVKTFSSSPVVPVPTTDSQAATKKYVDDKDTAQTGALTVHKSSSDHDGRYYTETELNAGQLDNRYYTETEVDAFAVKLTGDQTIAGVKTFSSSPIVPTPTTATQAANKSYVDSQSPLTIPNDSITELKMAAEMKKQAGGVAPYDDLTQAKGFYSDLAAWYGNTKLAAMFQTDETWTSGAGTQSADATNVKLGTQSLRITENDNTAGDLYSTRSSLTLTFATLNNGETSGTTDYIYFPFYISDVTKVDTAAGKGVYVVIGDNSLTNAYVYNAITGIATGWNYLKIPKSSFTTYAGTPAWTGITTLRVGWFSLINSQNAYVSFQLIQLVKKDPSAALPNPFQRYGVRDFAVNANEHFVGLENGQLVCKVIEYNSATYNSLLGTKGYADFISTRIAKCATAAYIYGQSWFIDANNYIAAYISGNVLTLAKKEGGVTSTLTSNLTIAVGDVVEFVLMKSGANVKLIAYKNYDRSTPYIIDTTTTLVGSGYLGTSSTGITTRQMYILSTSITSTEHASHADVAETANSVANNWKAWTPTLTWTTGTPSSITTIARYTTIGNVCYFNVHLLSADGNGATALKISLPVTPKDNNAILSMVAHQRVNTTWGNRMAYIDDDDGNGIQFRDFATATDNQAIEVIVSGFYEI